MIAAEPAATGDSRGWIAGGHTRKRAWARLVARALRPSSPILLFGAGQGRWTPQRLQVRDRTITNRQPALANAALLWSAVGLKQSFRHQAVTRQSRKPRTNAVWVAGPDRICFS